MLKSTLIRASGALGAWSVTRRLTRRTPRVFMLHRFAAETGNGRMGARQFERLLDRLDGEFELLTLRELVQRLDAAAPLDRPLAAVTVDDGYADFYEIALPILKARRLPATVYATTGFIAGTCWLWWDAVRFLVDAHPGGPLVVQFTDKDFRFAIDSPSARNHARSTIAEYLVTRNEERTQALFQLEAAAGVTLPQPPSEYAPMNWQQLRECAESGIEVGGHTLTHAFLPALDDTSLRREIHAAKSLMESELGLPLQTFAYPNGMPFDWSHRVEGAVQSAGFSAAVLAHPRPFDPGARYRMGRWSAGPDDPQLDYIVSGASDIKLRVRGA